MEENKMAHHIYPATRKKRSTEYAKSTQLLKIVGADKFKEMFSNMGMYLCAKHLSQELNIPVSPYVCRYIRKYKLNTGVTNNEESI
jgi:hypothetical protein